MNIIPDKFGCCIKCHKNLITEKNINNIIKQVTTPDYDQIQFTLDDESKMRVVICKSCKETLDEKDYKEIMKSIIAGWQEEVRNISTWSEEKKKKHMDTYKKKKIKDRIKEFKWQP